MGAEIKARMSLDASGVKAGVSSAKGHVEGFSKSLGGIGKTLAGAFGAGAIIAFTKSAVEMASRTRDMAQAAGLGTEQYQAFYAKAMEFTGGAKAAEVGLVAFRTAQENALDGNEATIEAFGRLGISLEDVAGKSTPQLLEAVAKGYKSVGDFGALVDLFGKKNAAKLEEALRSLAENGFDKTTEAMRATGLVAGDELSGQMDDLADATERMALRMQTAWAKVIGKVSEFAEKTIFLVQQYNAGVDALNKADPGRKLSRKEQKNIRDEAEGKFAQDYFRKQARDKAAKVDEKQKLDLDDADRRAKKLKKIQDDSAKEADDKKAKADEKAAAEAEKKKESAFDLATRVEKGNLANKIEGLRELGKGQGATRFDSLRGIGANVLGSGVIKPKIDVDAEIKRATEQTALNTAKIAEQLGRPPVARLDNGEPIY